MTKEDFIAKYKFDLAGRILAGIVAPSKYGDLGSYASDVLVGSHAFLDKIYTELVPQTPITKGPSK